jgi:hypothetical protein
MTKAETLLVIGGLALVGIILAVRSYRGADEGAKSVARGETQEFVGVLYQLPKGATVERSTVTGEVKITITKASPKPLKLDIIRESHEIDFNGMKHAIDRDKMGTNVQGQQHEWGWTMTYDATTGGKQHEMFNVNIIKKKGIHCVWNESTTVDQAAADAICYSIRPVPAEEPPPAAPSSSAAPGPTETVIHPTRVR